MFKKYKTRKNPKNSQSRKNPKKFLKKIPPKKTTKNAQKSLSLMFTWWLRMYSAIVFDQMNNLIQSSFCFHSKTRSHIGWI